MVRPRVLIALSGVTSAKVQLRVLRLVPLAMLIRGDLFQDITDLPYYGLVLLHCEPGGHHEGVHVANIAEVQDFW